MTAKEKRLTAGLKLTRVLKEFLGDFIKGFIIKAKTNIHFFF